jgi:hypothetical protein
MAASKRNITEKRVKRLSFSTCLIDPPRLNGIRDREEYESVYCLFDTDNGVTMYETHADAASGKREIEQLVEAFGPYQIARHELPLVRAAARAIRLLRQMRTPTGESHAAEFDATLRELTNSILAVFPFSTVRLTDGSIVRTQAKSGDEARQ